jgi:hypothetical protein
VGAPLAGDEARIGAWLQVLTGLELDAEGVLHVLDAPDWRERSRRLDEVGGPPIR